MVALAGKKVPTSILAEIERKSPRFFYLMMCATKKELEEPWKEIKYGSRK